MPERLCELLQGGTKRMKFNKDMMTRAKDHMRDTADGAALAYDMKRGEIEQMGIHKNAAEKLTPEEVRRAQRVGLVTGVLVILIVLIACAGLLMRGMGLI
jgi:hypothetical protein